MVYELFIRQEKMKTAALTENPLRAADAIDTELARAVAEGAVSESLLGSCLARIEEHICASKPLYWLLLARVNEAALIQTGQWADNGELQAAGDFLANPRKIRVYFRGRSGAYIKHRHGRISDQFNDHDLPYADFLQWFSRNAVLEQARPPILPELTGKMTDSGWISGTYLADCRSRMQQIAETISFLAAWGVGCFEDLVRKRSVSDVRTLEWIDAQLCNFSEGWFVQLGEEIRGHCTRTGLMGPGSAVLAPHVAGHAAASHWPLT